MKQDELLKQFERHLKEEEKSSATVEKYLRDVRCFLLYLDEKEIVKEYVLEYKEYLVKRYAPTSVNSMLTALNVFLKYAGFYDCQVKLLKIQRQIFMKEEKELSKDEYQRLLKAAGNTRLSLVLRTICGTGIRVSELQYITVEAVRRGKVFPHNLRHLFARTFYMVEKDVVGLADLLGHSSVNTTRIYTMETGERYMSRLERVQKILTT